MCSKNNLSFEHMCVFDSHFSDAADLDETISPSTSGLTRKYFPALVYILLLADRTGPSSLGVMWDS